MLAWSSEVRECVDDLAVLDDVVAIGNRRGETEVLFDQKDGEPFRLQAFDHVPDLLDDDRREAFGGFVQHQKPRACAQDARDRQHLLLAAGQFRALAAETFLQIRKTVRKSDRASCRRCGWSAGSIRFSLTSRLAKMPRSSGQNATPRRAILSDDSLISSAPSNATEPVRLPMMPMIDLSVDVLPAPLRPSSVTHLARTNVEIHPVQDVGLAVPRFEILDGENRGACGVIHGRLQDRLP